MDFTTSRHFIGEHVLQGCSHTQTADHADGLKFILDGKGWMVTEDPQDGYRSSLKDVTPVPTDEIKNVIPDVKVIGRAAEDGRILELLDARTAEVVLRIGTNDYDDYYPYFVCDWDPTAIYYNKPGWAPSDPPEDKIIIMDISNRIYDE